MLQAQTDTGYAVWQTISYILIGLGAFISLAVGLFLGSKLSIAGSAIVAILWSAAVWGVFVATEWPPYGMQYHTYKPITIQVQSTSARIIGSGNSVSQRIAVVDASGAIYGCDDTRCTTLKPGDVVTLMCEQLWQTNGTPGYVCNWGKMGAN